MLKSLRIQTAALAFFASAALLPVITEKVAAQSAQRYVQLVDYEIAPANLEKFIEALKENGAATIKEPGCLQFDFSQSASNPNQIFIYKIYENEAAVQAHRASDHFKKYVATTKDMAINRQIDRWCRWCITRKRINPPGAVEGFSSGSRFMEEDSLC